MLSVPIIAKVTSFIPARWGRRGRDRMVVRCTYEISTVVS